MNLNPIAKACHYVCGQLFSAQPLRFTQWSAKCYRLGGGPWQAWTKLGPADALR